MRAVLLAIAIAGITFTAWASVPTAKVEQGELKGTIEDGLSVYRGVPFAAPPVGDLRWRAPQAAAHWEGLRSAEKFAPQCMQSIPGITTSEDCLYLNVWSPAKSASALGGHLFPHTVESNLPRRELCWSALATDLVLLAFWRIPD